MKKTTILALCALLTIVFTGCTINMNQSTNVGQNSDSPVTDYDSYTSTNSTSSSSNTSNYSSSTSPTRVVSSGSNGSGTLLTYNTSAKYVGTIAGKNVHVDLSIDGYGNVSGYYYYDSQEIGTLVLEGDLEGNTIYIFENDDYAGVTATWTLTATRGHLSGDFIRTRDGKHFNVRLTESKQ